MSQRRPSQGQLAAHLLADIEILDATHPPGPAPLQTQHFLPGAPDMPPVLRPCTGAADGHPIAHTVTSKLDVRAAAERIGMKTSYQ